VNIRIRFNQQVHLKQTSVTGAEDSQGLDSKVDLHPLSASVTRRKGNDLLPNQKHEAKEDFSPVGPIVREIIWLK